MRVALARAFIDPTGGATPDGRGGVLRRRPAAGRVEVPGCSENQGSRRGDFDSSQRRARAVSAALVERGIDAIRSTAKGDGSGEPVADAADGRRADGRVQFKISETTPRAVAGRARSGVEPRGNANGLGPGA
jgi:OOP family OmpA-OmpF porin